MTPSDRKRIAAMGGKAPHARRTHWTPGKMRHELVVPQRRLDAALARLGETLSKAEIGRRCGVSHTTVARWLARTDRPHSDAQRILVAIKLPKQKKLTG